MTMEKRRSAVVNYVVDTKLVDTSCTLKFI